MEKEDKPSFMKFMAKGRSLLKCVEEGDLDGFTKIFTEDKKL